MGKKLKISLITGVVLLIGFAALYFLLYEDIPYYKSMEKVRIEKFTSSGIQVKANVICHNPNSVEVKLSGFDFKIAANGKQVAVAKQVISSTISADSDFTIPLTVSFSPKKLFKLKDLLGVAFASLKSKAIHMKYDGTVTVQLLGEDIAIPVEYEEDISFKN